MEGRAKSLSDCEMVVGGVSVVTMAWDIMKEMNL